MRDRDSLRTPLHLQACRLALAVVAITAMTGTASGVVLVDYPADSLPPPPWEFVSNGPPQERSQHTVFVQDGVLHMIDSALLAGNTLGFSQHLPFSPNQVIEVVFRGRVLSGESAVAGRAPFTVWLYNGTVYADLAVGPQSVTALGSQQPGSFAQKLLVNEPINGTDWHVYRYQLGPRGIQWWVDGASLGHATTEMLLPNVTDDRRINMFITSAAANVELDYLIVRQTPDPLPGNPVELGIFSTSTGIGSPAPILPLGISITYGLREGSTGFGGAVLAEIFDQIVIPLSNQTQIFDLFPNKDPVDFERIAEALTNGQPNVFHLLIRFSIDSSASGGIVGTGVEIPVPLHSQILFFRLTVAPFSIFQPESDPEFFQTTTFRVEVAAFGFPSPIEVTIDIKPGEFPNSINPRSKGVIPVAILTTDTFAATTVDPLSVEFGPKGATEAHGRGHIEDVNGDGKPDLLLHFNTQDTGIQCQDTSASLTGQTFSGQEIEGSDAITTVGCR